jgi:hypothetical protein
VISISALSRTALLTRTRRATRRRPGQVHAHVRRHPRRDGGHRPRRRRATTPAGSAPPLRSGVFIPLSPVFRLQSLPTVGLPWPHGAQPRHSNTLKAQTPFRAASECTVHDSPCKLSQRLATSGINPPYQLIHRINRSIVSIDPSYCSAIEPSCCSSIDASYCSSIDPSYCSPIDSSHCHSTQSGPFECLRLEPLIMI